MTIRFGALVLAALVPLAGSAAQDLDQFLREALRDNPRIRAAVVNARGAEARIAQAGAWDDPTVGVEYFATPVTSANPFKDGMETDYFIQQMIPFPGKKSAMEAAAEAGARMATKSASAIERRIVADVKIAYAMIYSAQQRLTVNAENREVLRQIVEIAREKYRVGSSTQADVLKAQVELSKLENEEEVIEQELLSAVAMMNGLRSAPGGTAVGRLSAPPLTAIPITLDSAAARALAMRPEILAMEEEVAMRDAELAAARRERLPDFMVRGMYKRMMDQTDQWAAMVGINVPLAPWSIGRTSGKVEENEALRSSSRHSLADMRNMTQAEVRSAYARATSAYERLARYRTAVLPEAEDTYRSTMAAYQTDDADFLSLLDSYRMLQMLRMERLMVEAEYASSLASLEQAIGGELE